MAINPVEMVLIGYLLVGCGAGGDSADNEVACSDEKKLADNIAAHAKLDGMSPQGLCALSQEQIAARLKEGSVWGDATDAERESRAQQYVTNCQKAAQAKADCGK